MTYRELLNLYRTGQLEDTQRRQVEADIEKQDAISEYLCEEGDIPGLEDLTEPDNLPDSAENDRLTAAIQKTIHRAFIKLGVTVGVVVLTVTLCAVFVLPGVVDHFFYQPNDIVGRDPENHDLTTDRLSLDLNVWTELFLPGRFRNNATALPRGYGTYDISIQQNSSADGRFNTLTGRLVRGDLMLYDTNTLRPPVGNAFMLPEGKDDHYKVVHVDGETGEEIPVSRAEERKNAFLSLRQKPNNDLLIAYISLDKITDYQDFMLWFKSLDFPHTYAWAGIYAEDDFGSWVTENTGVSISPSGHCLSWDRETYPLLSLLDSADGQQPDTEDEDVMTTHFLSLLHYLDDHPKVLDLLDDGFCPLNTRAARDYVEENGLSVYGLALVASRDDLMQLEADPTVSYISVTPY